MSDFEREVQILEGVIKRVEEIKSHLGSSDKYTTQTLINILLNDLETQLVWVGQ